MIYDTVDLVKSNTLPTITSSTTAVIIYLNEVFEDKLPGFYSNVDGTWVPFGTAGESLKTFTFDTSVTSVIDMNTCNPTGLVLSVLVTKNVAEDRSISLMLTSTSSVLEVVNLTQTYTTISVPQPHHLYKLVASPDLNVVIKTI